MSAEALLCSYVRTPIGRYGGALAGVRTDDLAAVPLRSLLELHPGLQDATDEVILGCANQAGEDNRNVARMALLLAGFAERVSGLTVNRLCASGMDAVIAGARMIKAGEAQLVVAGGVESMSRSPFVLPKSSAPFSRNAEIHDTTIGWRFVNPAMRKAHGTDTMPETAENVAAEHGVSRADQDSFAFRSQRRAAAASDQLAEEIVPVTPPSRRGDKVKVSTDEHPRPLTKIEDLARLPTPFREGGSVTAGNASGVNDGAAALVLASPEAARKYKLEPIARVVAGAAGGVRPAVMGVGPVEAAKRLGDLTGAQIEEYSVIELNEAFAAQALAVTRSWGLDDDAEHVNPNGGAIALGHPLGMSGARLVGTAALELRRRGGGQALATMCVGVGQGVAVALESV